MPPDITQKQLHIMKCNICGCQSEFIGKEDFSIRESLCPSCGSTRRQSDLAGIILNTVLPDTGKPLRRAAADLAHLSIYEAQASGLLHDALCGLPYYVCSEFFDTVPAGQRDPAGILCQDLQHLTFPSDYFDLIITQDVFEHIRQPEKAFSEIYRVLKPGGFHIFTIPYHEGKPTVRRIIVQDGKEVQQYPPVYHGDPLRQQGAIVVTDFGQDMDILLNQIGFNTENIPCGMWYSPSDIPYISDEKEYQTYLKYNTNATMLKYFKYNSWVFRTRKPGSM
jgi:SAM-dependent methyltransferase